MTTYEYEQAAYQIHNAKAMAKAIHEKLIKLEGDERQLAASAGYSLSSAITELNNAEYHLDKLAVKPSKKKAQPETLNTVPA